ncbi:MAG: sigma-54-dependent Fis family transcriptional regulator [Gammaproteobacteria bacterium]|nr:MAG: sigma-54-dependent Fis family transcriptional regulator [Gammaproteobacteria bacterium]
MSINHTPKVLIVDDEPDILQLLTLTFSRMSIPVDTAENCNEAKEKIHKNEYHFCLTDMRLPDGTGMDIIDWIQTMQPNCPVAVLTAHGNMELAIEALKRGAFDFVSKPVDINKLRELVETALKLSKDVKQAPASATKRLLGVSTAMIQLRSTIQKVARSQAPVMIYGESGTGKELVARLIHDSSPRTDGPFVPVNCGAIPSELIESELFGHVKGAFTGAHQNKIGLFEQANGGTLFLDEVAELPVAMQVKLLRVLQEKAIRPVGDVKEKSINVRILCATHKNLSELVQNGQFRQDLYYRLNVIEIHVPPLRKRKQDIADLANHFLKRIAPNMQLTRQALRRLTEYHYPGNVRELENIIERAVALTDSQIIDAHDLDFISGSPSFESSPTTGSPRPAGMSLDDYLHDIEKRELLAALEETGGNKTKAAELLGISFRSLRYKLKKHGLSDR